MCFVTVVDSCVDSYRRQCSDGETEAAAAEIYYYVFKSVVHREGEKDARKIQVIFNLSLNLSSFVIWISSGLSLLSLTQVDLDDWYHEADVRCHSRSRYEQVHMKETELFID